MSKKRKDWKKRPRPLQWNPATQRNERATKYPRIFVCIRMPHGECNRCRWQGDRRDFDRHVCRDHER